MACLRLPLSLCLGLPFLSPIITFLSILRTVLYSVALLIFRIITYSAARYLAFPKIRRNSLNIISIIPSCSTFMHLPVSCVGYERMQLPKKWDVHVNCSQYCIIFLKYNFSRVTKIEANFSSCLT